MCGQAARLRVSAPASLISPLLRPDGIPCVFASACVGCVFLVVILRGRELAVVEIEIPTETTGSAVLRTAVVKDYQ